MFTLVIILPLTLLPIFTIFTVVIILHWTLLPDSLLCLLMFLPVFTLISLSRFPSILLFIKSQLKDKANLLT